MKYEPGNYEGFGERKVLLVGEAFQAIEVNCED
jgi:hypothetical protein